MPPELSRRRQAWRFEEPFGRLLVGVPMAFEQGGLGGTASRDPPTSHRAKQCQRTSRSDNNYLERIRTPLRPHFMETVLEEDISDGTSSGSLRSDCLPSPTHRCPPTLPAEPGILCIRMLR